MLRHDYRIGGEQSGHTIFTGLETTGDGEVTALQFLQVLAGSGKRPVSWYRSALHTPRSSINVEVPHSGGIKEKIMACDELKEAVAKEEAALQGRAGVLVRASGTEALIRVMVEAKTAEGAQDVAQRLTDFIKSLKF